MSNYDRLIFVDREKKFRGFQKLLQPTTRQAIMLIEAPRDMGKTWLLGRIGDHCREPHVGLPVAHIDFRHPRLIHEIQDSLGLIRLLRDQLGRPAQFSQLNATINAVTEIRPGSNRGLITLRQHLEAYFSLDDLRALAFDLQLEFENLAGETRQARVISLLNACRRHNLLDRLVALCRRLRPAVDWDRAMPAADDVAAPAISPAPAISSAPAISPAPAEVADEGGRIWADTDMERRRAERLVNDAFFAAVIRLMQAHGQVVFLFDSTEAAPDAAEAWIREELLLRLRDGLLPDVVIILSGRKTPDLTDMEIGELLVQTDLDPFTENHVREYFEERRRVMGLDIRTVILTSGGVPGALAMMADHALAKSSADDDFFSDL